MACTQRAVRMTAERGIHCGGHLILGLPGETREMLVAQCRTINEMPLDSIKLHQLQILNGSLMAADYREHPERYSHFELEEYIGLVADIVERTREDMVIERFAGEVPPRCQAAPERSWRREDGRLIRNEEIPTLVEKELARRNSRQGMKSF